MSVRQIATWGVAGVMALGATLSIAGGKAHRATAAKKSGVYVGLDVGTYYNNTFTQGYLRSIGSSRAGLPMNAKHTPWAWAASFLVGYQFDKTWALQAGYLWFQRQSMDTGTTIYRYRNNGYYLALRATLDCPICDYLRPYFLIGASYNRLKYTSSVRVDYAARKAFISPVAGAGLAYALNKNMNFRLQYLFVSNEIGASGNTDKNKLAYYRSSQRITLGADYLFCL